MTRRLLLIMAAMLSGLIANASDTSNESILSSLKNYQVNSATMVSAGLPNRTHFEALKGDGVTKVIDLLPGDREEQSKLMSELELTYYNIPVDWDNPTLANFDAYVTAMNQSSSDNGKTLTHCRLNWRGAVFTYLYRVTQLGESQETAQQDMLAIWHPNKTWRRFIDQVLAKYSDTSGGNN